MTALSKKARLAGLLYILASAVGFLRLGYIPKTLFVHGDATATAKNIADHETLFRLGILSDLLGGTLWLFVPLALYRLLNRVDKPLAVLMVILGSLMQVPLFFVNSITDAAALVFSRGADLVSAFEEPQRDALAMLFLNLHHQLDIANEIFWGLWLLPFALLVYRSRFLPRVLGVLLAIACFAWLALSITAVLAPRLEAIAFKFTQPLVLGEVATMFWLAVMGARERTLPSKTAENSGI